MNNSLLSTLINRIQLRIQQSVIQLHPEFSELRLITEDEITSALKWLIKTTRKDCIIMVRKDCIIMVYIINVYRVYRL